MILMRPRGPYAWISWAVLAISVPDFAIIAFVPQSRETHGSTDSDKYEVQSITVIRPQIWSLVVHIGLGGFFALAVLSAIGLRRLPSGLPILIVCTACLGPAAPFIAFLRHPVPWVIHSEIRGPDGATYGFAESSFLQGQRLALYRVRGETFWTQTLDVLVSTHGDSPRSYLRIVRPAGAAETYGRLDLTDDGWLLGIRSENRCFFAYDLRSGRPYGYGEVEHPSPFLALECDPELHGPDAAMLLEDKGTWSKWYPEESAIRTGLYHSNPRVRDYAAQMLKPRR